MSIFITTLLSNPHHTEGPQFRAPNEKSPIQGLFSRCGLFISYRLLMYMVTSKPKRMSL